MTEDIQIVRLYERYKLPLSLQEHMLRVAAVALQIADNWRGNSALSRGMITRVLLVHDIGNVVKIDLQTPSLGNDGNSTELIQLTQIQRELRARFGKDDHQASSEIARELGFSEAELVLLNNKIFIKNDVTLSSNDFNLKLAAYADQRVAPSGVMCLLDRLLEAKERYKDKPGSSMNNPRTEYLIQCAIKIEEQIEGFCSIPLSSISDKSIVNYIEQLKEYRLKCC